MKKIILLAFILGALLLNAEDTVTFGKLGNDAAKWKFSKFTSLGIENGMLQGILTNSQPMIYSPEIALNADTVKKLSFKMRLPEDINLYGNILFVTADSKNWSDSKMVNFKAASDGKLTEYVIDMSKNKFWKGTVTQIRFTPIYVPAFKVWSSYKKYIEFGGDFLNNAAPYKWKYDSYGLEESFDAPSMPTGYDPNVGTKALEFKLMMKARNPKARIVFLGDSLTFGWLKHNVPKYDNGSYIWNQKYLPLNVQNCALSGDKVQHTLWQLTDGKILEGMNPELFVILIGINNVLANDSSESIVYGIKNVIHLLKRHSPEAKILLLGLLPTRFAANPAKGYGKTFAEVNKLLPALQDNKQVFYVDLKTAFLNPDGTRNESLYTDGLHFTKKGYAAFDNALMPQIERLLKK